MKHKATIEFTKEEKEWMDTLAVNYVIAQTDGFQLGYGQALSDFTEYIIDYWNGSDDKPQESIACPYVGYSDCLNEHEGNKYDTKEYNEGCIRCKMAWLERIYDTYPSDDGIWEVTE